jgi:hypothetical protein
MTFIRDRLNIIVIIWTWTGSSLEPGSLNLDSNMIRVLKSQKVVLGPIKQYDRRHTHISRSWITQPAVGRMRLPIVDGGFINHEARYLYRWISGLVHHFLTGSCRTGVLPAVVSTKLIFGLEWGFDNSRRAEKYVGSETTSVTWLI